LSSYEVWLSQGNIGTEQDFINAMRGENGLNGTGIQNVYIDQGHFWITLTDGQLIDAGSYQVAYGCTNISACNYSALAGADDGTCIFPGTPCDDGNVNSLNDTYQSNCQCQGLTGQQGCTNPSACNFNALAIIDNGSCILPESSLCTDNNILTVNDYYDENCICIGFTEGSDFVIGGGVTDVDGNQYSTVIINGKEWMAENLRVTKYRNGNMIGHNLTTAQWTWTPWGAYTSIGNDYYGKVYNKNAILDSRQICPLQFHVATSNDWNNLFSSFQGQTSKLLYISPNSGGAVTSGMGIHVAPFFADYDGWSIGNWNGLNLYTYFSIPESITGAVIIYYGGNTEIVLNGVGMGSWGMYVRCVKDQ
jgi:uncharacterized protein (TIGR02145 family)